MLKKKKSHTKEERAIETTGSLQNLKYLQFGPLQKKLANPLQLDQILPLLYELCTNLPRSWSSSCK